MRRRSLFLFALVLCALGLITWAVAQTAGSAAKPAAQGNILTFKANTEVVLVNVTARDKNGNLVTDLKPSEVQVYEGGKLQHISSFDFENIDASAGAGAGPSGTIEAGTSTAGPASSEALAKENQPSKPAPASSKEATPPAPPDATQYRDRRLIVLYFDLTTMQPEDVQNVMEQATKFVQTKMQPADMAAIATLGNSLRVNQDFTDNKTALVRALRALNPAIASGFAAGGDGSTDGTADDGSSFSADDTEFNIANADRSLQSMQSVCDMLTPIQQKKSMIYFSSGVQRSGVDNEITLRSAVNSCVKANTAIYSVDAQGLQAMPPGGNATGGSIRGASAFNGGAQANAFNSQFAQQETIATLSNDTGGKSFLDSNDFAPVYSKVQQDTRSYYLIGYTSTDRAQDGKYRKIQVKVTRPGVRVSARPGYYAPRDINHMNTASRQQQLQDELNADISDHSLDLYLADGYFRLDRFRYYVPVSIVIPGDQIPMHGVDPKATPEVDVAGEVIDQSGRKLDHVTQTIKLTPAVAGPGGELRNKNLQFNSGFVLAPGQKYNIRFAARENQTGQMGAFDAVLSIPDLEAEAAKPSHILTISPVLVGSQLIAARPDRDNPMTQSGQALVINVNHVFSAGQHLYMYYEVYDPKLVGRAGDAINLLTNVAFFHGKVKVFESQLLATGKITDPGRNAAVVQIDIPLGQLKPGYYLAQVNAVDAAASKFAFPRIPILLRPATPAATAPSTASNATN